MAYGWSRRVWGNIEGEINRIFEELGDFKTYRFFANGNITISVGLPRSGEAILKLSDGEHNYAVEKKEGENHVTFYELMDKKDIGDPHQIKPEAETVRIELDGNGEYLDFLKSLMNLDRTLNFEKVLEDDGIY
ncbi:MAG: hypothetical protein JW754_05280 [Candidatus Aenigmarchaeota archaeon]|nr:hypothetical protein [Candidatus Aenigmarchaeota archaeon]